MTPAGRNVAIVEAVRAAMRDTPPEERGSAFGGRVLARAIDEELALRGLEIVEKRAAPVAPSVTP
jgi:hypothetical protein